MKKTSIVFIAFLAVMMCFVSCDKNEEISKTVYPVEEGNYSGTFTVTYFVNAPKSWKSGSGTVTLKLEDDQFICEGKNTGGQGMYEVNNNRIKFFDMILWHFIDGTDHNVMLNGGYNYAFDGENLTFSKENQYGIYKYKLKKQ